MNIYLTYGTRIVFEDRKEVSNECEEREGNHMEMNFLGWSEHGGSNGEFLETHDEADEVKERFFTEELHTE